MEGKQRTREQRVMTEEDLSMWTDGKMTNQPGMASEGDTE